MKHKRNPTFFLIIAISSLLTLIKVIFYPTDFYSIISILIGLTGILLFLKGHNKYDSFFYAWVILQFPNFYLTDPSGQMTPIMNAFPTSLAGLNIGIGLNLGLKSNSQLTLYINVLPVGLYYLLKYLNIDKPLGKRISISRLKKGTFSQINFPLTGTVEKIAGRNKMTGVYVVSLDNEIQWKDKNYKYILLEPQKNNLIQTTKEWQVCGFRICDSPDVPFSEGQNPFIDWVTLQLTS